MQPDQTLFASHPVNQGRQTELDIMKGLAIMGMVLIHSFERFSMQPLPDTISTYAIEFGCSPGAPIFMFLMGLGLIYTQKKNPGEMFSRGVKIFLIGYLLNFCRGSLLYFAFMTATGNPEYLTRAVTEFWGIDILQFAGLTFMFFGAAARLKFRNEHYLMAAAVAAIATLLGAGFSTTSTLASAFSGLFLGTSDNSFFPFFTWIEYPVFGYLFGSILIRCQDKRRFYNATLLVSLAASLLFILFSYRYGIDFGASDGLFQQSYYHHDLMGNLILLSLSLVYISLIFYATPVLPGFINSTLNRWSHNIINMYCISWLIIYWSTLFMPESMPFSWIMAYFAIVLLITDIIAVKYLQLKRQLLANKKK